MADEVKRCTCETEDFPWGVGYIKKVDPDCPVHGDSRGDEVLESNPES